MKSPNLVKINITFSTRDDEKERAQVNIIDGATSVRGSLFPVELAFVNSVVELLKAGRRYNTTPDSDPKPEQETIE